MTSTGGSSSCASRRMRSTRTPAAPAEKRNAPMKRHSRYLPLLLFGLLVLLTLPSALAQSFKMFPVERSSTVDSNFATEAPWLLNHGGITVICPWSLDEGSNGGNTASAGYTWNVSGNFVGCGAIVQNYLSIANGGLCAANCPIISMVFDPIQTPSHVGGNTFTPTYVFSSACAATAGAAAPQDAVECNTAGQAYLGDSTYLNSVTNVNSTPIANVATGLPVTSEKSYMLAWKNFIAAAKG